MAAANETEQEWFRDPITEERYRYAEIPIDKLHKSELNPRDLKADHVEELKSSIDHHGQLVPMTVVEEDEDGYEILGGNHRLEALSQLQRKRDEQVTAKAVVYHRELSQVRRLEIARELNEKTKSLNFGERARHQIRIRKEMLRRMENNPDQDDLSEKALARNCGATSGSDKRVFLLGPLVEHVREQSEIGQWVGDSQTPISLIRDEDNKKVLTAKNLSVFLKPFINYSLIGSEEENYRDVERKNAVQLCNMLSTYAFKPLWEKEYDHRPTDPHQPLVDLVRHHPFKALGRALATNPEISENPEAPLYVESPEKVNWEELERVIRKIPNVDWGKEMIANERAVSKLALLVSGELQRAQPYESE